MDGSSRIVSREKGMEMGMGMVEWDGWDDVEEEERQKE